VEALELMAILEAHKSYTRYAHVRGAVGDPNTLDPHGGAYTCGAIGSP